MLFFYSKLHERNLWIHQPIFNQNKNVKQLDLGFFVQNHLKSLVEGIMVREGFLGVLTCPLIVADPTNSMLYMKTKVMYFRYLF